MVQSFAFTMASASEGRMTTRFAAEHNPSRVILHKRRPRAAATLVLGHARSVGADAAVGVDEAPAEGE